jgi:hypothetical protein
MKIMKEVLARYLTENLKLALSALILGIPLQLHPRYEVFLAEHFVTGLVKRALL